MQPVSKLAHVAASPGLGMVSPAVSYPLASLDKPMPVSSWPDLPLSSAPADEEYASRYFVPPSSAAGLRPHQHTLGPIGFQGAAAPPAMHTLKAGAAAATGQGALARLGGLSELPFSADLDACVAGPPVRLPAHLREGASESVEGDAAHRHLAAPGFLRRSRWGWACGAGAWLLGCFSLDSRG